VEITTESTLHNLNCEVPGRPSAYNEALYGNAGFYYLYGYMTTIGNELDGTPLQFDPLDLPYCFVENEDMKSFLIQAMLLYQEKNRPGNTYTQPELDYYTSEGDRLMQCAKRYFAPALANCSN
jgi:hypothetical protein